MSSLVWVLSLLVWVLVLVGALSLVRVPRPVWVLSLVRALSAV
ncbi:hypothetical protein ACFPZL_07855 [Leucobacter soli]|nr:hypothetical protein [Leucobacter soli]